MQSLARERNRWAGYTGVNTQRYQHRPYSPQHRPAIRPDLIIHSNPIPIHHIIHTINDLYRSGGHPRFVRGINIQYNAPSTVQL